MEREAPKYTTSSGSPIGAFRAASRRLARYPLYVSGGLAYDETVRLLRAALVEAEGNARAFTIRGRGRPELVSSRSWHELSEIETLLAQHIEKTLRGELRVEPRSALTTLRAHWRALRGGLAAERSLARRLFRENTGSRVQSWREQAPQLEHVLWPFFVARTQHLANTFALALNEPAPSPPLIWHPGRREFRQQPG